MASTISLQDKQIVDTQKLNYIEFMQNSILIEYQLHLEINFNWEIFEIIREVNIDAFIGLINRNKYNSLMQIN